MTILFYSALLSLPITVAITLIWALCRVRVSYGVPDLSGVYRYEGRD